MIPPDRAQTAERPGARFHDLVPSPSELAENLSFYARLEIEAADLRGMRRE
jgi:hypothetical protein